MRRSALKYKISQYCFSSLTRAWVDIFGGNQLSELGRRRQRKDRAVSLIKLEGWDDQSFEHNMIVCCLWIWNDIYKIWWTWLHNPSSPPSLPKSHMAPLEPLAPPHTLHLLYSTLHIFYFSTLLYFSHTPLLYFCAFLSLNQPLWVFSFYNK